MDRVVMIKRNQALIMMKKKMIKKMKKKPKMIKKIQLMKIKMKFLRKSNPRK